MEPFAPPHTHSKMKCKNRSRWGGGHRSHNPTNIQLAQTIPRFLQKRLEPQRGKNSHGRNKFGRLSSFLFLLVCFGRRSLRMRVERPTGPPPSARWRAHASPPARTPGFEPWDGKLAHLPSPHPAENLANTSRARTPLTPALLPNP